MVHEERYERRVRRCKGKPEGTMRKAVTGWGGKDSVNKKEKVTREDTASKYRKDAPFQVIVKIGGEGGQIATAF